MLTELLKATSWLMLMSSRGLGEWQYNKTVTGGGADCWHPDRHLDDNEFQKLLKKSIWTVPIMIKSFEHIGKGVQCEYYTRKVREVIKKSINDQVFAV